MDDKNAPQSLEIDSSLDTPETVVKPTPGSSANQSAPATDGKAPSPEPPAAKPEPPKEPRTSLPRRIRYLFRRFNLYLVLFVLLLVVAGAIAFIAFEQGRQENESPAITTQSLTQETLDALRDTEATVGDPKQILTIESNTVISGQTLIRNNLDVAGQLRVGGALSLPGITVSGTSNFEQVQASSLAISGDTAIQGQLNVENNLTVSGSGSFGGSLSASQITVQTLQLSGDLQISRHIDAGGSTPGKSDGSSLGSGGTASVSGTDTAGTVTINTGGSPPAGCFVTINFVNSFNANPHVVITPVGSNGAELNYYVNRSTSSFSICTANSPTASRTYVFDYIAIE